MAASGRAGRRRQSLYGAVLAAAVFSAPVIASNVAPLPLPSVTTYEQALSDYDSGNISAALLFAKAAGEAGDARAQVLAGHIYRNGEAGVPNLYEAAKWYRKAALLGDDDAMVALGEMGYKSQGGLTPEDAKTYWTQAAQAGRQDAMRALADLNIKGLGVPRNQAEGVDWLILAADGGDAKAAKRMGDLYIDSAPETALAYYEKAAAAGDADAAYTAAIMYAENLAIKPNQGVATKLMEQAARGGHPAAMADYGLLIFQGIAGDGTPATAAKWFEKAARADDDQGKFFYAYSLAKGDGVSQDFEAAYRWVIQTDKSGIPDYDKDIDTLRSGLEGKLSAQTRARIAAQIGK